MRDSVAIRRARRWRISHEDDVIRDEERRGAHAAVLECDPAWPCMSGMWEEMEDEISGEKHWEVSASVEVDVSVKGVKSGSQAGRADTWDRWFWNAWCAICTKLLMSAKVGGGLVFCACHLPFSAGERPTSDLTRFCVDACGRTQTRAPGVALQHHRHGHERRHGRNAPNQEQSAAGGGLARHRSQA